MVAMTPEAVTARLRAASDASRALVGMPGPQAVSMSRAAVDARLREWAELTRMCLLLERDVRLPPVVSSAQLASNTPEP